MIGLISDTHGLIRAEAIRALSGVEMIIHAGDVGSHDVLAALREIAPVTAIRGNIDKGRLAAELPATVLVQSGSILIYVLHDLKELDLNPAKAGIHVVISGHSHKPARREDGGVLYVNPGSAGPRRFRLPVGIALLDLGKEPWQVQFVDFGE